MCAFIGGGPPIASFIIIIINYFWIDGNTFMSAQKNIMYCYFSIINCKKKRMRLLRGRIGHCLYTVPCVCSFFVVRSSEWIVIVQRRCVFDRTSLSLRTRRVCSFCGRAAIVYDTRKYACTHVIAYAYISYCIAEGAIEMLTRCHVLVWGGDARQIAVIEQLVHHDATVSLVGFDRWDDAPDGARKCTPQMVDMRTVDAVVLPVSGVMADGRVEATYAHAPLEVASEYFGALRAGTPVYTGVATDALVALCASAHLCYVPLLDRDDIAIHNSIPTAEGVLYHVIQNTVHTIHGARVVVFGFGRTGMTICRTFKALGAHVAVAVYTASEYARAWEMGVAPFWGTESFWTRMADADVIINTVPAPILTPSELVHVRKQAYVLDISSAPGGIDCAFAAKRQLRVARILGLPAQCAPYTAGKIIASVLLRLIHQHTAPRSAVRQEDDE
jgi:dipicolinate synthase subunit A